MQEASSRTTGFLTEIPHCVLAVKLGLATNRTVNRIDELGTNRKRKIAKDATFQSLLRSANSISVNISAGILLLFATDFLKAQEVGIGDLALFTSYTALGAGSSAGFLRWISNLLAGLRRSEVPLQRLCEIIPLAPEARMRDLDRMPSREPRRQEEGAAVARPKFWTYCGLPTYLRGMFKLDFTM